MYSCWQLVIRGNLKWNPNKCRQITKSFYMVCDNLSGCVLTYCLRFVNVEQSWESYNILTFLFLPLFLI